VAALASPGGVAQSRESVAISEDSIEMEDGMSDKKHGSPLAGSLPLAGGTA
jgi:hypothetical protein